MFEISSRSVPLTYQIQDTEAPPMCRCVRHVWSPSYNVQFYYEQKARTRIIRENNNWLSHRLAVKNSYLICLWGLKKKKKVKGVRLNYVYKKSKLNLKTCTKCQKLIATEACGHQQQRQFVHISNKFHINTKVAVNKTRTTTVFQVN